MFACKKSSTFRILRKNTYFYVTLDENVLDCKKDLYLLKRFHLHIR